MSKKLAVFQADFTWTNLISNKSYTPEISPLINLATNKKDAAASDLALLV